jgi:hypothetical protein
MSQVRIAIGSLIDRTAEVLRRCGTQSVLDLLCRGPAIETFEPQFVYSWHPAGVGQPSP